RITNHHDLPLWMHPVRPATRADYASEPKSKYEIWQVLGWPFETSVAMARIVFSGMFMQLPKLRIITHHCGGMIPYFAGRAETLWAQLGSRSADEDESQVLKKLGKPPLEFFKMFYGDTVLGGAAAPLACGIAFFGADRVVFASDCPFDPEGGPMFIREGIRSVEELGLPERDKRKIYFDNAVKLLRMEGKLRRDLCCWPWRGCHSMRLRKPTPAAPLRGWCPPRREPASTSLRARWARGSASSGRSRRP